MNKLIASTMALSMVSTGAIAGGVDRSGQGISQIFGEGNVATLSFGYVVPEVSGVLDVVPIESGDMASDFAVFSGGIKMDLTDELSAAVFIDQPFGADVAYPSGGFYPINGTTGTIDSTAINAVARYKLGGGFSVHAGARLQTASADVLITAPALYAASFASSQGVGYLAGVAFEKPEIALRVDLTYNSEIDHTFVTTEGGSPSLDTETTLPSSWNLNFQTGIAEDTLLFGSIRYVDWPVFDVSPFGYVLATGDALISYDDPSTSYTLGLGRRFNDNWSGAVTAGYEASTGGGDNFGPTDGYRSLGVGATYTEGDTKVTFGASFSQRGDTSFLIDSTDPTSLTNFTGNTVTSFGVKLEQKI